MSKRATWLMLLVCSALFMWPKAHSDELGIGFAEWGKDMNWLLDAHPAADFLRRAATDSLLVRSLEEEDPKGFKLSVADNLKISADSSTLSFRLKAGAGFVNGQDLRLSDVLFSLEQCKKQGLLQGLQNIKSSPEKRSSGITEEWVELVIAGLGGAKLLSWPGVLADCPILEASSSTAFGAELGVGTNMVSLGPYRVTSFSAGREYTLSASEGRFTGKKRLGSPKLNLRAFKDANQALTALRIGTLDAFFTLDGNVLEKAKKDETLLIEDCSIYMIIHRKGFKVRCHPNLSPIDFRYAD